MNQFSDLQDHEHSAFMNGAQPGAEEWVASCVENISFRRSLAMNNWGERQNISVSSAGKIYPRFTLATLTKAKFSCLTLSL